MCSWPLDGTKALSKVNSYKWQIRPHFKKLAIILFLRKRWIGEEEFKKKIYRQFGMKNESMEQVNALKSCPFSPGAIWSEQQVMSMVKIHVPVIWKTRNLNPESSKCSFNGFLKKFNLKKNLKMWLGPFSRVGRGRSPALFFVRPYDSKQNDVEVCQELLTSDQYV